MLPRDLALTEIAFTLFTRHFNVQGLCLHEWNKTYFFYSINNRSSIFIYESHKNHRVHKKKNHISSLTRKY